VQGEANKHTYVHTYVHKVSNKQANSLLNHRVLAARFNFT